MLLDAMDTANESFLAKLPRAKHVVRLKRDLESLLSTVIAPKVAAIMRLEPVCDVA